MATHSEIYVRGEYATIELWRHWASHKEYMVPYFKKFARFAGWAVGGNKYWLTRPGDVAAMLIAFDYETTLAENIRFTGKRHFMAQPVRPDIRPREASRRFGKVWILDLPKANPLENPNLDLTWRVRGYSAFVEGKWIKRMRAVIHKGKDPENRRFNLPLRKEVDFTMDPTKREGERCKICGYPGPLLVMKNPPVCLYCLLSLIYKENFFRSEIEKLLKVFPLICQS